MSPLRRGSGRTVHSSHKALQECLVGDGHGAGQGRRGLAQPVQQWVRSRDASSCCLCMPALGERSVHSDGAARTSDLLRSLPALRRAFLNVEKETAMALVKAGADVHSKCNDGYGLREHLRVAVTYWVGWSLRSDGASRNSLWLCSSTALHLASQTGHAETASALVKGAMSLLGADVRGADNVGYGVWLRRDTAACATFVGSAQLDVLRHGSQRARPRAYRWWYCWHCRQEKARCPAMRWKGDGKGIRRILYAQVASASSGVARRLRSHRDCDGAVSDASGRHTCSR